MFSVPPVTRHRGPLVCFKTVFGAEISILGHGLIRIRVSQESQLVSIKLCTGPNSSNMGWKGSRFPRNGLGALELPPIWSPHCLWLAFQKWSSRETIQVDLFIVRHPSHVFWRECDSTGHNTTQLHLQIRLLRNRCFRVAVRKSKTFIYFSSFIILKTSSWQLALNLLPQPRRCPKRCCLGSSWGFFFSPPRDDGTRFV